MISGGNAITDLKGCPQLREFIDRHGLRCDVNAFDLVSEIVPGESTPNFIRPEQSMIVQGPHGPA